jgi:peptidoglycan/xylan/chitin deacetylase (PgdA/CDA1 family)
LEHVVLHSITRMPESTGQARLDPAWWPHDPLRPLIGPFERPIVRISGPESLLDEAGRGLPDGAARPEAVAVRLRRAGVELSWGDPDRVPTRSSFLRLCRSRGASSVELVRADPTLLTELQLGSFFHAYWRRRVLRRALLAVRLAPFILPTGGLAPEIAFWRGVRSRATEAEWERFTQSSYVVFYYHGVATGRSGWEQLHAAPRRVELQLRLLRRLGFRPLSPDELIAFHADPAGTLPPRSFVVCADDGFRTAVEELGRHAHLRPQIFVNTTEVGGTARWAGDEPLAGWDELDSFVGAGGVVGSHCRTHPSLPQLDDAALEDEIAGSLRELRERLPEAAPLFAYPYGLHDERVRSATAAAGYSLAFTTEPGRNGAGTDAYCLRRIGLKDWDGTAPLLWLALAGELLPWFWERWRRRRTPR